MDHLAQNLDELFDVLSSDGHPTGVVKRRGDVHRDGDWHRAIHVWVYGVDGDEPYLLLQQRGRHKDTWPLALDATVGGHLGAGEKVTDALREVREEIGIDVDLTKLTSLGTRQRASENDMPGIVDREFQEIFALRDDRPLTSFAPNPNELEALVRVTLDDLSPVVTWQGMTANGTRLLAASGAVENVTVDESMLLMNPGDDYMAWVVESIRGVMGSGIRLPVAH